MMAGSFLGTLPIVLIFLIFQRRFIEGIIGRTRSRVDNTTRP